MTDPEFSDHTYIEPLTVDILEEIIRKETPDAILPTVGGQTALNLCMSLSEQGILKKYNVEMIGAKPEAINKTEDRSLFKEAMGKIGLEVPRSLSVHTMTEAQSALAELGNFPLVIRPGFTLERTGGGIAYDQKENDTASNVLDAIKIAKVIGYPVLVRPSFVLGGRAMVIVYDDDSLKQYMEEAVSVSEKRPVLIDKYLEDALEVDVDCIADGQTSVISAIMEHVEYAGVHSGDSACIIPAPTLSNNVKKVIRRHCHALCKELNVIGLMNVQIAVKREFEKIDTHYAQKPKNFSIFYPTAKF